MPKFLTFEYHKENGEASDRVILTINPASPLYLCFDVTQEVEEDEKFPAISIIQEVEEARKMFFERIYDIGRKYSLPIKTFKQDGMVNVNDITKTYTFP
jgi:hypothetical protein